MVRPDRNCDRRSVAEELLAELFCSPARCAERSARDAPAKNRRRHSFQYFQTSDQSRPEFWGIRNSESRHFSFGPAIRTRAWPRQDTGQCSKCGSDPERLVDGRYGPVTGPSARDLRKGLYVRQSPRMGSYCGRCGASIRPPCNSNENNGCHHDGRWGQCCRVFAMIGGRRGEPGRSGRYVGLYYNIEAVE